MNSNLLRLNSSDVWRSISTSLFAAAIATLYGVTSQAGFDVFAADWLAIAKSVVNATFIVFFARITEKLSTDADGSLKPVTAVKTLGKALVGKNG